MKKPLRYDDAVGAFCFVRRSIVRDVGTRRAVSVVLCQGLSRWKRSTGTFPKLRNSKRDTGRSGLVRSALEKLSLFSPTFPVRQKHGAGNFAVCGQRLRGHVPSKNTSPTALSWISLFGVSFLKSFCFCTMLFVILQRTVSRQTIHRCRSLPQLQPNFEKSLTLFQKKAILKCIRVYPDSKRRCAGRGFLFWGSVSWQSNGSNNWKKY